MRFQLRLLWNFIEITPRQGCSPVNLLHIFRVPFRRTTTEGCFCSILPENRFWCFQGERPVARNGLIKKFLIYNAQKMKLISTKDFFSKYNQVHRLLWIWSHLPKKSFTEEILNEELHFLCSDKFQNIPVF